MNDNLTGQLVGSGWRIPRYAQGLIYLETGAETVRTDGPTGLFTLTTPAETVVVRWAGAAGPALTELRWRPDALDWRGAVRVGGVVDSLHMIDADPLPDPLAVLAIGGVPLRHSVSAYPAAAERVRVPYAGPDFYGGCVDTDETTTQWIAAADSAPLTLAQDALVTKLRVYAFGQLVTEDWGWHTLFALPLHLTALTVFAG